MDLPAAKNLRRRYWRNASTTTRVFVCLFAAYVALTVAVLLKSPVLDLDDAIRNLGIRHYHPWTFKPVHAYVTIGQRRPMTMVALPLLLLIAWRTRSARPLISLVVSVIVLNVSVGVVKVCTGRLGPRGGFRVDALFQGGDIYPSGHVAGTVVTYGLVAMFVAQRWRRWALALAGLVSVTVGLGTIVINTHWLTDIVGGWLAGALVLCSLPWLVPPVGRYVDHFYSRPRAAISVLGGAVGVYLNLGWLTSPLGHWINSVFGGWLLVALVLSILPWLTPPLEHALTVLWKRMRGKPAPETPAAPTPRILPSGARVTVPVHLPAGRHRAGPAAERTLV